MLFRKPNSRQSNEYDLILLADEKSSLPEEGSPQENFPLSLCPDLRADQQLLLVDWIVAPK
jgi:hypothetical protein